MENASKALLIAGAILIAILLISIGLKTMHSTSDVTDQTESTMQSSAVSAFNSRFLPYLSNSTSGAQAKSLVSKVLAHNATVSSGTNFSVTNHQIYINVYDSSNHHITSKRGHNWTSAELQDAYNKISDTKKYRIYVTSRLWRTRMYRWLL